MQAVLIGSAAWIYVVYEAVFLAGTLFHHSNVKLPLRVEQALNTVFVTPRIHGIHHSAIQHETNSNYSNYSTVFSCWHRVLLLGSCSPAGIDCIAPPALSSLQYYVIHMFDNCVGAVKVWL